MSDDQRMYEINMHEASEAFARCWRAARRHLHRHLQKIAEGPTDSWLRSHLNPPFLEHLSFQLGNQLFFIRIEDVDDVLAVPGSRAGLVRIATGSKGHCCLMPMRRRNNDWHPVQPGWGLMDARSRQPIDPPSLVSDEKIEMTDWELHDFAVEVVRDHIAQQGRELTAWQGYQSVDPSIWFIGDNGPEWVVVRAARYPLLDAEPPADLEKIKAQCASLSTVGHFASVGIASSEDAFDPNGIIPPTPLWRGHGMFVRFKGFSSVST